MSLYIGGASDEARPSLSILPHTLASLALGFNFGLALSQENEIVSWGDDSYGQSSIPSFVEPRPRFVEASCGWAHSLLLTGLTDAGMVYSCGWNSEGQCGTPLTENGRATFQQVSFPSASKIVYVSAGEKHSLLLDDNGKVWAFGSNSDHQLGLGSDVKFSASPKPVKIETSPLLLDSEIDFDKLDNFEPYLKSSTSAVIKQICCGSRHSLAIDEIGFVYGWGWSGYMQLGQNEMDDVGSPGLIDLPEPIKKVSAGTWHSLFLGESGTVYCAGWGEDGQLGLPRREGQRLSAPIPVPILYFSEKSVKVLDIAAGSRHSGFVTESGEAYYCGKVNDAARGPQTHFEPVPVSAHGSGLGFKARHIYASHSGLYITCWFVFYMILTK